MIQASAAVQKHADPYRVLLVDDSAIIRGLIARILEAEPDFVVAATAGNGAQAIQALQRHSIDVVILDIEMPVMDGLTALPRLLEIDPGVKVIVASTLTQRNAQISLKAMQAGAADYIPKPSSAGGLQKGSDFRDELLRKARALSRAHRGMSPSADSTSAAAAAGGTTRAAPVLRRQIPRQADVIAIGSSTGGPQALLELLRNFDPTNRLPILITQHMPPTFTAILAEHVAKASGRLCREAIDGETVDKGKIYVAPGNWHMKVQNQAQGKVIRLNQDPPENFCRPSVDPMLRSLAEAYDGRCLVVMLTGMGQDGLKGSEAMVAAGGTVIAQDEASSVVWGMPGAVTNAGLCSAVLPLSRIASYVSDFPKRLIA